MGQKRRLPKTELLCLQRYKSGSHIAARLWDLDAISVFEAMFPDKA